MLEIRSSAAGFEVRLRRGDALHDDEPFVPLVLPEELWQQAADLREHGALGGEAAQTAHGAALESALPRVLTCRLKSLLVSHSLPAPVGRVVLQLPPGVPPGQRDPAELAWECMLPYPCALQRLHDAGDTGATTREPLLVPPLRVLLVLTSLEDPGHRIVPEAQKLVTNLRNELAEYQATVELRVAASACDVVTDAGGRPLLTGGGEPDGRAPLVQDVYRDVPSFCRLLRNGSLDRDASGDPVNEPPHAVVFFGHSDAEGSRQATALRLRLHEDRTSMRRMVVDVRDAEVRESLAEGKLLGLVVTISCSSGSIANRMLNVTPHVVAMQGLAEPFDWFIPLGRLVRELARGRGNRVYDAVQAARAAIDKIRRFQIQHVSSQCDSAVFVARHEQALDEYHRRLAKDLGWIRPRHGAGLRVELGEICVPVQFRPASSRSVHVDFDWMLRHEQRLWVLRGGPGAGKTTTLLRFALRATPERLPLYVHLRDWLGESGDGDHRFDAVVESLEKHIGIEALATALRHRAQAGELVLLADGYDELPADPRKLARKRLDALVSQWKACTFVVACREMTNSDEFGDEWRPVDVCELDRSLQLKLVEHWMRVARREGCIADERHGPGLLADISASNGPLVSNPLMLTFLVSRALFQQGAPTLHGRLDVLIDMIGDLLAHRYEDAEPHEPLLPVVQVRELLATIAWTMTKSGVLVADTETLTAIIRKDERASALVLDAKTDELGLLWRIARHTGLLLRHTGLLLRHPGETRWRFAHRYLQEALTAEHWWQESLAAAASPGSAMREFLEGPKASESLEMWTQPALLVASRVKGGAHEALIQLADRLIARGSKRTALDVLSHAGDSRRCTQLRALVLGKSLVKSEVEEGERLLEKLRAEGALDVETYGILGGIKKRPFVDSVIGGRSNPELESLLHEAHEVYSEGFSLLEASDPGSYYLGVNVLATAVWEQHWRGVAHDTEAILQRVRKVLDAVEEEKRDHWYAATVAEVELLSGEIERSRILYREAVARSPHRRRDHASMRRQARLNLVALGEPRNTLDQAFGIGNVAAFTGHMIDRPGRSPARFPRQSEADVARRLRETLDEHDVRFGFSQAADGGDLLFIEALLDCGGEAQIILPFPPEDFALTSVLPAWRPRFQRVLYHPRVQLEVLGSLPALESEQEEAFRSCNNRIADLARAKARDYDDEPMLICVWDGTSGKVGGTGEMVAKWRRDHLTVLVVDPRAERGDTPCQGGAAIE
ncbi:MAG: hypothetical protein IPM29_04440 [Planctomycetes bacterium]|nr:hypothetical protein [Planctomycetota bacterium]